jgi:competence protein ComEC
MLHALRFMSIVANALAFAFGCYALQLLAILPDPMWVQWLALAPVLWWRRAKWRLIISFAGAFLWASLHAHVQLAAAEEVRTLAGDHLFEGEIVSLVQDLGRVRIFNFRVAPGAGHAQFTTRLRWYQPPAQTQLRAGQRWRLVVRLRPVRGYLNPGGVDSVGYWFRRGIYVSGYVRDPHRAELISTEASSVIALRGALDARLRTILAEHSASGLVRALVLGVRAGISPEQRELLRVTGTAHLVAISGLHIGLVALLAFGGVAFVWRHLGRLPEHLASQRAGAIAAVTGALAYALMAGLAVSTQRALVMVSVAMLALWLRRRLPAASLFGMALVVLAICAPTTVLEGGAWLSFGAVAALIFALQGLAGGPRWLVMMRAQWVATIALAPLTLSLFGQVAVIGFIANLLAIPLVGLVIVPLLLLGTVALLGSTTLGVALLHFGAELLAMMLWLLRGLAELPFGLVDNLNMTDPALWFAAGGSVLLISRLPGRAIACLWWLPAIYASHEQPADGEIRATVLDVGQGLAVLVQTRRHALLFDTGPGGPGWSLVAKQLGPSLSALGVQTLDTLIISHADSDHAGGVPALLADWPVTMRRGDGGRHLPKNADIHKCVRGQSWEWDGVQFEILHPHRGYRGSRNNRSCVLQVRTGSKALLLPGDIEATAEAAIVAAARRSLASQILVAAHHGSRTSSTASFIEAVAPQIVVFSSGAGNRFGMPHAQVRQRFERHGVRMLNTALDGAIGVQMSDTRLSFWTYAQSRRRYWHARNVADSAKAVRN